MITKLMKKYGWLGVLCAALAAATAVHAEEATPGVSKAITAPTAYPGKIVVVDKNGSSFTVEIQGQLYLFKATAQTRLLRKGKVVQFKDLAPGQEITLVIQQASSGEIQVVSLTVENSDSPVEAAGTTDTNAKADKKPVPGNSGVNNLNPPSQPPVVSPYN
ncbi:MAG: hypothetical protein JWM16_940 [Verrucomicrobiales bacterium]|nr:hypothetical protein [Verrucomicrobiales bacterium]